MEKDNKDQIKKIEALIRDLIAQLKVNPSSAAMLLPMIYALLKIPNIDQNLLMEVDSIVKSNDKKMSLLVEAAQQKANELTEVQKERLADFYIGLDDYKNTVNELESFMALQTANVEKARDWYIKAHGTHEHEKVDIIYRDSIHNAHVAVITKKEDFHKAVDEKRAALQDKYSIIEKDPAMTDHLSILRKEIDMITEHSKKELKQLDDLVENNIKKYVITKRVLDKNHDKSLEEKSRFIDEALEQSLPIEQQDLIEDYLSEFGVFLETERRSKLDDLLKQLDIIQEPIAAVTTSLSKKDEILLLNKPTSKTEALETSRQKQITSGRNP